MFLSKLWEIQKKKNHTNRKSKESEVALQDMHCADVPGSSSSSSSGGCCAGAWLTEKSPENEKEHVCACVFACGRGREHVEVHTVVRAGLCDAQKALVGGFVALANWCWLQEDRLFAYTRLVSSH